MITEKVKAFQKKLNIQDSCTFSSGLLPSFKVHHCILSLNVFGEHKSADLPSAEKFVEMFLQLVIRLIKCVLDLN